MPEAISLDKTFAILGDEDLVMGFKALGFNVYPVKGREKFELAMEEAVNKKIPVLLIQESLFRAMEDVISSYKGLPFPVIIPFSKEAKTEALESIIKDIRLRATGAL